MKISKLEYVKMQIDIQAAAVSYKNEVNNPGWCKTQVDRLLEINGITVSDESGVKPFTQSEIVDLFNEIDLFNGRDIFYNELKKRGLVVS